MDRDQKNKIRVLLNGGPTRAYLDEVRFLSNVSTGSLAYEIAQALLTKKNEVVAVMGPTALPFSKLKLKKLREVETIEEMRQEMLAQCRSFRPDYVIFSAAVLDFAPVAKKQGKVSSRGKWNLSLKPTPKIIDEIGKKFPEVKRIGFKLQWEKRSRSAAEKFGREVLKKKGLEGLCLNYLSEIHGKNHPALLFIEDEKPVLARNKKQIARWIASICRR